MMRHLFTTLGVAMTITGFGLVSAQSASACGGFFCNNQAVDQSGENILFVYNDDGTVTTVVQIFYEGPSEQFAWILPIPSEPEVDVGTDAVFQQLAQQTNPAFTMRQELIGTCRNEPGCWGDRAFESDGTGGPPAGAADAGAMAPDPGVEVHLRANVGPYDVAVIRSGSVDAITMWLDDNGYLIPDEAVAELGHYVALEHFFVALRLQKDRGTGEIQPIVLRSENNEPCIPIRLTRIATVPDMPVRAYFIGDQRVRPFNYMLVNPDFDDSGLWRGEISYEDYISRVVDDAGGHAFVTDYAGDVPSVSLEMEPIDDLRSSTDPSDFLMTLRERGFNGDSQLMGILLRFLPPPEMWEARTFYNCLTQRWCLDDPEIIAHFEESPFEPGPLVDALVQGIVDPRNAAQEMVDSGEHLTRLFTTLSADEMDVDPMFMRSAELAPEYGRIHEATLRIECGPEYFRWTAPSTLILPSGTREVFNEGVAYYGSDSEYCEDYWGEGFHPGTPTERLREIARARNTRIGGGGLCSVSPTSGASGAAAVIVLLGLLGFVWRRRAG